MRSMWKAIISVQFGLQDRDRPGLLHTLIAMVFASLVVLSPLLGTKVVDIFGVKFTAGVFTILFAFSLLDVVNELWSKQEAQTFAILIFFIRLALFFTVIPLIISLPTYLAPTGYQDMFRMGIRTFIASEILTLVQNVFIDIPIFNSLKRIKLGFFFRANVSNIISWSFGTFCFVLISFWGAPKPLLPIILGQTLIKFPVSFVYAFIGTLVVGWARRAQPRGERGETRESGAGGKGGREKARGSLETAL